MSGAGAGTRDASGGGPVFPRLRVALVGDYPRIEDAIHEGGVQSVTHQLAHALARRDDVECHVVCATRGVIERDTRRGALQVHFIPRLPLPRLATARLHDVPRLVRAIRALRPDIVHGQGQTRHGLAAVRSGLPTVVTPHGVIYFESRRLQRHALDAVGALKRRLMDRNEREVFRRARDMILISPYLREAYGPMLTARTHYVDNPIEPVFFDLPRDPEPGRLLFAGTVVPRKCVPDLVAAVAHLGRPEVRLRIAGPLADPASVDRVRRVAAQHELAERVVLTGALSQAEMLEEYRRAEILLLASREETSPLVIAQAMACGLPVVASAAGGVPHMVRDGETALLFPFGDVRACADRIRRLLDEPDRRERMATQARVEARRRFHPEAVAAQTVAVYREMLK
jgi:glycosyltransferase involved in cell wall biosynthesis